MGIPKLRIQSFILCCCWSLNSQNEAQEVSERFKKLQMGTPKNAFPGICRAAATVIDPLKLLLALTGTQNLGDIPATAAQSPLPPKLCGIFRA